MIKTKSKFITPPKDFSNNVNKGEKYFRDVIDKNRTEELITGWKSSMQGKLGYINALKKAKILPTYYGERVLELGAGCCWFGSILSKEDSIKEIYCVDLSENLLKNVAPHIMGYLHARDEKIVRVLNDYDNLKFEKDFFDSVAFDSSLHHSKDVVKTLEIANNVLKKGGYVIAHREPILPLLLPNRERKRRKFATVESTKYGVIEKTYTLDEWGDMFQKAGFRVKFVPYMSFNKVPKNKIKRRILNFLCKIEVFNKLFAGYFHNRLIFVAKKL
jgi:ubiquinone/menaquinone biosynthesis C-methylase UbiE